MSSQWCDIVFDNNANKVFFGGQVVAGEVILTLTKDKTVKSIFIDITGLAECRWCEHVKHQRLTYRGSETYLDTKTYLLEPDEHETITVSKGSHTYPFTCQLPEDLPTSFEGTFGRIRYQAKVTLNIPLWPDKTFSEGFTVIKCLKLNEVSPDIRQPISVERSETFNAWCFLPFIKTSPLTVVVNLPAVGYTAGQKIDATLDIVNNSNTDVSHIIACLLRIVSYCATERGNKHKTEHVRYSEVQTIGCRSHCTETLSVSLLVPAGPPTDSGTSNVCRIRYEVEVKADVGRCSDFPSIRIPVTIGTIPFVNNLPRKEAFSLNSQPYNQSDNRLSIISYDPDLPSYEQATVLNPADDGDEVTYSPLYPIIEFQ